MTGRMLYGVTLYDKVKAYRGFTLFAARMSNDVWLIDMEGRIVHRWPITRGLLSHAHLLPNGNLLCGIRVPGKKRMAVMPSQIDMLHEVDWDNNPVWEYEGLIHHDWCRLQNGNTLVSKYTALPDEIAAKVKGGLPGSEWVKEESTKGGIGYEEMPAGEKAIWGDCYQEITAEGKVVWEWRDYEHLDLNTDIIEPRAPRKAWSMNNSFCELPDGNILVSWVYLDTVAIIDKTTGDIKWRYGPATEAWHQSPTSGQHHATFLPNGNIMLFDNGRHRISPPSFQPPDFSRVIEINPQTDKIVWEYKDKNPQDFYSPFMSSCERLPNNNRLILEASHGRIFEVTYDKEMVWEYVSPFYINNSSPRFGITNMIFRAHRYSPDYPGLQGKDLNPARYETWNRLYCPEAYSRLALTQSGSGIAVPSAAEQTLTAPAIVEQEVPPSSEEEAVRSRLENLGY